MKRYGNLFKVGVLYSVAGIATQIVLYARDNLFLVDTGDGTLRDLLKQKIDLESLRAIFFTHGHTDHVSGLFALLAHLRNRERKKSIEIIYPEGIVSVPQIIEAFKNSFPDFHYVIESQQIKNGETIEIGPLKAKAFQMTHYAAVGVHKLLYPDIAFGYRFSFQGESIAITGDTGLCVALEELVRGADIALMDSSLKESEVTEERLYKLHLSEEKAREIGKLARKYIPIHSSPLSPSKNKD